MQARTLAVTTAVLIATAGVLPAAGASAPTAPAAASSPSALASGDGVRDRMLPAGHSPRGAFLYGRTGEYVISPSGATVYRHATFENIQAGYRLCGDVVITGTGPQLSGPVRVSWKNLATGKTGTSLTDYGTNLIGPAPGGILYAEQTPSALDKSTDIILRAPGGSKRRLATVPGFFHGGPAACDTSGIALISSVAKTATTAAQDVLLFVKFTGGAVTIAKRAPSASSPLKLVEVNGTSVLWSVGQALVTAETLYRTDVGSAAKTIVTVPKGYYIQGAGASATETLYSVDHNGVTTTTSLRSDGTRVALTGGPYSYSTWLRSGSSWRGAGEDGMWSLTGTTASQVWQPPHVLENVYRDGGPDRYATATRLQNSPARPPLPLPDTVYIASGTDYPDALSGGPAAARAQGAMLLTAPTSLPATVRAELTEDTPQEIVILGGTGAVSAGVESALRAYAPTVRRVSGTDRYQTAAAVSSDRFPAGLGGTVVVASGASYTDALTAGPAAGHWGGPLLLTSPTALPAATAAELDRLQPGRVVLVGGTGVVSTAVETALAAHAGSVQRVSGADRYTTAAKVSAEAFPGAEVSYLVTGEDFPDGLAAGAVAAREGGPLLLTPRTALPAAVKTELARLRPSTTVVVGSEQVTSQNAYDGVLGVSWP